MFGRKSIALAEAVEMPTSGDVVSRKSVEDASAAAASDARKSQAKIDRMSRAAGEVPGGGGGRRKSVAGGGRKSVAGGGRKSVAGGGGGKQRRKSVTATTPKELGAQALETTCGAKVGQTMWAKMPPKHAEVYDKGLVTEVLSAAKVKVQLPDGSNEEYAINDLLPCNTESNLEDVCSLTYLSEAAVLDCVRVRFLAKVIYTWVARILIAMNPFERLKIYDNDMKAHYAKTDPRSAAPHIFAVGEAAYRAISRKGKFKNQAIIVSGESGSGKTVGNKLLMDYFAYRSGGAVANSATTAEIANVMKDSNPVLEAFGNAKTTRNSNSSRFGKFQIMHFSDRGEIGTITISTYLLEKSRVTSITDPERNYHAFYMLLNSAGHSPLLLGDLELSPTIGDYYYLKQSTCHRIDNGEWDDAKEFAIMADAMPVIGADAARTKEVFTTVAIVLHLGNIIFGEGDSDEAVTANADVLAKAAKCAGIAPDDLTTILTTRELKGPGGTKITKGLSKAAAERGRDAISKAIFVRVFDWLVACMNDTIKAVGEKGGVSADEEERFVGLVDLFGFEQFKINSFEQLCINFANERLQQFFLQYVFYTEEAIHKEEGVTWPSVELPDNQGAIDVISAKDTGILLLLDGASKLASAKEGAFFENVNETHKKSRFYKKPKGLRMTEGFCVKHYAGDVTYHAGQYATGPEGVTWLDKNNYALADDQQRVLSTASLKIVAELFPDPSAKETDAGVNKKKVPQVKSAAKNFMSNLEELMTVLGSTQVHFVRCVKSCMEQKPGLCSGKMVLNQLRCNGTMEAVEVMQAAFPSRIPYEIIHSNVVKYLPEFMQAMTPNAFFEVVMAALEVPREKYQLGMTKLFMKAGTGKAIEELAEMDIDQMVPILTAKVQEFEKKKNAGITIKKNLMRHYYRKRYGIKRKASKSIQRIHRSRVARRRFLTLIAICVEVNKELRAQKEREEAERKRQQEELERQQAELKKEEDARKAREEADAFAAAAEAAKLDADAAEKFKADQKKKQEEAAAAAAAKKEELASQAAALEADAAATGDAPVDGLAAKLLAGSMLNEPDIGDRLSGAAKAKTATSDGGAADIIERLGEMGISKDIMSRVSMRFVEHEQALKDAWEAEDDDDDEDEEEDDEDDEDLTLDNRAAGDDKVFEVVIVRHETTGSLGLELDEYKGVPTVCAIMLGGPADQDGTLQMGDTVVAIDGKPTHNMEDVKRAVISASSSSLRLAVLRKPVVVMRRERAYMNMPDTEEDEEWEQFEITLFSNRQLTFEKLSPPFVFGSIELPAAKSLRLMKVQYNVCLQIATNERSFEFYTDSLMTLYEWQRMLRSLMLSNTVSIMSGWLTLIADNEAQLKRWWFDLCGSTHELCYFETDQCQALNLPAQGCIDLSDVRVIDPVGADAMRPIINARRPKGEGTELTEHVRLMCDVHRQDETLPIGLDLNEQFRITRFGPGSPAELSSSQGGLQVGDLILAVDGHEVDPGTQRKKKTKAVRELLRDLDTFPKQVHTFTVERSVPVVMQDGGALQVRAKSEHWILYPCSSDEVPLEPDEYNRALEQWIKTLHECAQEAREAAEDAGAEAVLQQLWVELEEDDEWKPYWCTLTVKSGLSCYDEKEDAAAAPESPVCVLPLEYIKQAGRAPGIDFYDGVIDVEVHNSADMWRIRPSGHAAMHNLLSALNIYKVAPPSGGFPGGNATNRGKVTMRAGSATSREKSSRPGIGANRKQSVIGGLLSSRAAPGRKESVVGGGRKQSVIGAALGGLLSSRATPGRKESVVGSALPSRGNLPLGGGLPGGLTALREGTLEEETYVGAKAGPFAALQPSNRGGQLSNRGSSRRSPSPGGRKFSVMPGWLSKR